MGHGGGTGECLEMVAVRAVNYTPGEDECDMWAAQRECFCSVYFQRHSLMLSHCHLRVFVSQTAHPVEPYSLSSAEVCSLTSSVNKMMIVIK
jgi:hypothetical protein